jgi:hypothetical protein
VRWMSKGEHALQSCRIVWNRGWQKLVSNPRELRLIPDTELPV